MWHLWPSTARWLWSSLIVTVGLYVHNCEENQKVLRVLVLLAGNILPSSSHPFAVVLVSPLLQPLDAMKLTGFTNRPLLVASCLSPWGLVLTAGSHLILISALAQKERRAALQQARSDTWRPISIKTKALAAIARGVHVVIFGSFALVTAIQCLRKKTSPQVLPLYCLEFTAAQFWSAVVMGAVAVLERSTRHASVALSLAPSRYIQWALQIRDALQHSPHEYPIFTLAMACEAIRVTNSSLAAFISTETGPSIVAQATATLETFAFLRAVLIRRQQLLFMRWLRAPQLAQGMLLGLEELWQYNNFFLYPKKQTDAEEWKTSPASLTGEKKSPGDVWVPTEGSRRIKVWVYEAVSDHGEEVAVALKKAPGLWRRRGPVWTTLAASRLQVRLPGAMRELAAIDGKNIIPNCQKCVAKAFTRETTEWLWEHAGTGDEVYFRDAYAYLETARLAQAFNEATSSPDCVRVTPCRVIEIIESQSHAVTIPAKDQFDLRNYLFVEPFIQGSLERFSKFNSNAFNPRLLLCERIGHPLSDAFSHFTHTHTQGRLLVCDIQGVATSHSLTITDPQIHTREPCNDYGVGNGGSEDHIRAWFASHVCRGKCRDLGLSHPFSADLETGFSRVFKQLHWSPFFFRHHHEAAAVDSLSWFRSVFLAR